MGFGEYASRSALADYTQMDLGIVKYHFEVGAWKENFGGLNSVKVEECIMVLLVEHNGGRTAEQLADEINRREMQIRKDGQPVSVKQLSKKEG